MKPDWKKALLLMAFFSLILLTGCAPTATRYVMNMPSYDEKPIEGLQEDEEIVVSTDKYADQCATGENIYLIAELEDAYKCYSMNTASSEISFQENVQPADNLFWDALDENKQGGGEMCFQTLMMATPCGGKYSYGFYAERELSCTEPIQVVVSYSEEHREETWGNAYGGSTTYYENTAAGTQKFVVNDDIIEIDKHEGYSWAFTDEGNIDDSRYYLIDENSAIASVPEPSMDGSYHRSDIFYFDLVDQRSWGADLDFPKPYIYVDFVVSPNKDEACFVVQNEDNDNYYLWTTSLAELSKNTKMLRADN